MAFKLVCPVCLLARTAGSAARNVTSQLEASGIDYGPKTYSPEKQSLQILVALNKHMRTSMQNKKPGGHWGGGGAHL